MNEEGNEKLGKRIKQARQEAGMSQKELARRVDRTQGVVSTVENGLSTIDAPDLPRWAVALGKSVMYFYLGEGLRALGRTEEAIQAYQRASKQNPNDAASLSALGCLFCVKGENPEIARVFCQQSVAISPENGLYRHRLGGLYLKENRLRDALEEFKKANQLGHDSLAPIEEIQKRLTAKAS